MDNDIMEQVQQVIGPMLDAAEAMIPRVSKIQKLYFNALVNEGFTEDQALKIVCSNPVLPKQSQ